jgi:hypothetical protein
MAGVLSVPAIAKAGLRDLAQSQSIIKFSISEQSGIGGDRRAVELKAQLSSNSIRRPCFRPSPIGSLAFQEL